LQAGTLLYNVMKFTCLRYLNADSATWCLTSRGEYKSQVISKIFETKKTKHLCCLG